MAAWEGNTAQGNEELLVELDNRETTPTYPLNLLVPDKQLQLLADGGGDCRPGGGGALDVPTGRLVDVGASGAASAEEDSFSLMSAQDDSDRRRADDEDPNPDGDMDLIFQEALVLADQFKALANEDCASANLAQEELLDAPMSLPGDSDLLSLEPSSLPSGFAPGAGGGSPPLTPAQAVLNALVASRMDPDSQVSPAQAVLSALIGSGVVPPELSSYPSSVTGLSPQLLGYPDSGSVLSPFNEDRTGANARTPDTSLSRPGASGTFTRPKLLNGNYRGAVEARARAAADPAVLDNRTAAGGLTEANDNMTARHVATSARNIEYSVTPVTNGAATRDSPRRSHAPPRHKPPTDHASSASADIHHELSSAADASVEAEELSGSAAPPPHQDQFVRPRPPQSSSRRPASNQTASSGASQRSYREADLERSALDQQEFDNLEREIAREQEGALEPASGQEPTSETDVERPPPSARNLQRKGTYVCRPNFGTYRVDKKQRFGTFKVDKSLVARAAAEISASDSGAADGEAAESAGGTDALQNGESPEQTAAGADQCPEVNTGSEPAGCVSPPTTPPRTSPEVTSRPAVSALPSHPRLTSTPLHSGGSSAGSSIGITPIRRQGSVGSDTSPPNPAQKLQLRGPARPPGVGLRPPGGLRQPSSQLRQPVRGLRQPSASGLRQPAASGLRQPTPSGLRQPSALRQPAARGQATGVRQSASAGLLRPSAGRASRDSSVGSGPNHSRSNPSLIEDRSDGEGAGARPAASRPARSQLPGPVSRIPGRGGVRRSAALTGSLTNLNLKTSYGSSSGGPGARSAPSRGRAQDAAKLSLSSAAPPSGGGQF